MATNKRVLLVDDDQDILDLLKYNLEKEGYEIKSLASSARTLETAEKFQPHLIILDIMMPEVNGVNLCRELRQNEHFKNTYIFFLTARSESYYQHAAYDTGGDDYIEKVIGLKSLTKKINSVLKDDFVIRKSVQEIRVRALAMNRKNYSVQFGGKDISVSRAEFEFLFFFAQNKGRNIASSNVIQSLWGSETYLAVTNVEVYIHSLKRKFGFDIIHQINASEYRLKESC
jgi:two-component system, OmpR family, alkaline phosphatase synthesis response regulator PhoP